MLIKNETYLIDNACNYQDNDRTCILSIFIFTLYYPDKQNTSFGRASGLLYSYHSIKKTLALVKRKTQASDFLEHRYKYFFKLCSLKTFKVSPLSKEVSCLATNRLEPTSKNMIRSTCTSRRTKE